MAAKGKFQIKWLILGAAAAFALAAWAAVGVGYFVRPSLGVWVALVTTAALSLELLFWVGAGVFGWSFLNKRRAALARLRDGLFGRRRGEAEAQGE